MKIEVNTDNTKPLVSVVMITYKHEEFIVEAIEGVLMQEVNFPVELIISDDCSPDGTAEIVQKYINEHPNGKWIKYTRHDTNKGMMPNFFWALEQAKGEYIALCEGDDYWTDPLKLQKQVGFLEKNKHISIISHNVNLLQGNELIKSSGISFNCKVSLKNMIRYNMMNTLSVVFRNKLVAFDYEILAKYPIGDWPLFCLILKYGDGILSKEVMATYRVHDNGAWSNKDENEIKQILTAIFEQYKKDFPNNKKTIEEANKLLYEDYNQYNNMYNHIEKYKKNKFLNKIFDKVYAV
jgi:glycosyltransferase involved in cell wall biosynthesis